MELRLAQQTGDDPRVERMKRKAAACVIAVNFETEEVVTSEFFRGDGVLQQALDEQEFMRRMRDWRKFNLIVAYNDEAASTYRK